MYFKFMNMTDFFENLLNSKSKPRKKEDDYLKLLYQVPQPDKGLNRPKFQPLEPNITQQADLLFLPNDKGYKYALVVVDVGSDMSDAEPLKTKEQTEILQAFKTIYERGKIKLPKRLETDAGREFLGKVKQWFLDNKVGFRPAQAGRHRQQAKVERFNQIIGKALFQRMSAQELLTEKTSRAWVQDLPLLINALNKKKKKQMEDNPPPIQNNLSRCQGDACKVLPIGSKVRIALDAPVNVAKNSNTAKPTGKFRSTDIRWSRDVREVKEILLKPNQPPMYLVNKFEDPSETLFVPYTKNQLQLVKEGEKMPDKSIIREEVVPEVRKRKDEVVAEVPEQVEPAEPEAEPEEGEIEKITRKRKINGKVYYKVHFKNTSRNEDIEIPRVQLIEMNPLLVKNYEKGKKKKK